MSKRVTDTKDRILNSARTLYTTHGCEGTTLDDILTASGVTKGAFYHYFKSKNSLCEALIEIITVDYQQLFDSIDASASPLDRLRSLIGKLDELNASGKWLNCQLMQKLSTDTHQSHHKTQKSINSFWHWYIAHFTQLIYQCRNSGQLTTEIPLRDQTRMIMSVISGAINLKKVDPDDGRFANLTEYMLASMTP